MSVIRGFGRVGDAHQRRRVVGLFEGLGDHERDRLALMVHPVVLEHVQALADVRVHDGLVRRDRRAAARSGASGRRCTPGARSAAALSIEAMRPFATVLRTMAPCAWPGTLEFGSVGRAAGHLLAAVDAADAVVR